MTTINKTIISDIIEAHAKLEFESYKEDILEYGHGILDLNDSQFFFLTSAIYMYFSTFENNTETDIQSRDFIVDYILEKSLSNQEYKKYSSYLFNSFKNDEQLIEYFQLKEKEISLLNDISNALI